MGHQLECDKESVQHAYMCCLLQFTHTAETFMQHVEVAHNHVQSIDAQLGLQLSSLSGLLPAVLGPGVL
jgi:hypothetical protein